MSIAISVHVLFSVIWVGGMFFAHVCLRPVALAQLEPPARLQLWNGVFSRFFPIVWVAIISLLVSGLWIIFAVFGGMGKTPLYAHAMFGVGLIMIGIFSLIYFRHFAGLQAAVATADWPVGGQHLARIRHWVGINLMLGIAILMIATLGKYGF